MTHDSHRRPAHDEGIHDDAALTAWLLGAITAHAKLDKDKVGASTPLYCFGIDSRVLMTIIEEAETRFGRAADLDRISPAEPIAALVAALPPADQSSLM